MTEQHQPPQVIVIQQDKTLTKVVLWVLFIFFVLPIGMCCGGFGCLQFMAATRRAVQYSQEQDELEKLPATDQQP